ncbi:MAG: hypothetical protein K2J59_08960 [Eubacterium sp.]|nr:hypothetical protein [Eubacterium sp.]
MKKSKRIAVLIVAVLMTVTMFSSTVPAYADTFYCGSYKVTTGFTATKTTGICQTYSDYTCEYVIAMVFGQEVDKTGQRLKLVGDESTGENAKRSGFASIGLKSSNAVKFESVVSTHVAKIKGIEKYKTIPRYF